MISARRLLGSTYCSCIGFTVVRYCSTTDSSVRPRSLPYIPQDAAQDALIGIGIHKDFDIHFAGQLLIGKDEDALHDDDLGGMNLLSAVGAVMDGIIVYRAVDGMACLKGTEVLDKQGGIKGIGVIVIEQPALFKGQLIVALVVAIMVQHAYICAKVFLQLFGHGGFSAASTARYSDHHSIHKIFSPPVFSYSIIFRQASQRLGPDFLCETAKNSRLPGADMVQCE